MADQRKAVVVRFDDDLFTEIEKYRGAITPIPTRHAAITALIRRGLRCTEPDASIPHEP